MSIVIAIEPATSLYVAVRTALSSSTAALMIRKTVQATDPVLAVADIRVMDDLVSGAGAKRRFQTVILVGFAFVALSLAIVGLYGLMAYMVSQTERPQRDSQSLLSSGFSSAPHKIGDARAQM